MLNLKKISKLFLATFVFGTVVTFSHVSYAEECTGNAYQILICEQQKELAAKNAKSNERADKKAEKEKAKATEDSNKALAKANKVTKKITEGQDSGKKKTVEDAKAAKNAVVSDSLEAAHQKKDAQERMNDALERGDLEGAQSARDEMIRAHDNAEKAEKDLKKAKKDEKKANKDQEKMDKAAAKAEKAHSEIAEKEKKAEIKGAKKQEKTAEKDLKKANKEVEKLQKKCEKNPEKCDVEALGEAKARLAAAKELEATAQKNREDVDGTTEEAEKAAYEASLKTDEEGPEESEIICTDPKDPSTCVDPSKENKEKLDKNGNPAKKRCTEATTIFEVIACKAMTTLADIRVIVYTIAGFGLIAFAFAAIFNKISWKHLAHICVALFILSMMTPFIEYFSHDDGTKLKFGQYLPAGFSSINGTGAPVPCDTKTGAVCPDVDIDTSAKNSKWSWRDLKGTVQSGLAAAKGAYDTYQTVKSTVETVVTQAQKIGTAIKNGEGGLTGILDTVGEISIASNTILNSTQLAANAVVANTSAVSKNIQNAGKSRAELQFDQENKNRMGELEKKMAAGNLSPQQMEYAKAELEQRKAAVDKNVVGDFADKQGKNALGGLNKVISTGTKITKATTVASNAAQQGARIGGGVGTTGGDIVGSIFGLATLAGEGIDIDTQNKQAKADAAAAQKAKAEKAKADAAKKAATQANNKSLSEGKQWDNSYNAQMESKAPTADKPVGDIKTGLKPSGSEATSPASNKPTPSLPRDTVTVTTTTSPGKNQGSDGYNFNTGNSSTSTNTMVDAVRNPDGGITQSDGSGNKVTFDKNGNVTNVVNYVTGSDRKFDKNGNEIKGGSLPSVTNPNNNFQGKW